MEGNQQLAQLLSDKVQDRIDKVDGDLFEEVEWDDPAVPPAVRRSICRPASSRSSSSTRRCTSASIVPAPDPARRKRELDRWGSYVRGLEWKSLQPWTPSHPGNFRHLHQLFEGKSMLIAYVSKKTDTGRAYYVAAKLDLGLIAKDWIPDEIADVSLGHRRVAILDEVARPIYGTPQPATQFQYESSFGKTLYAWRVQITPSERRRAARAGRDRAAAGPCCWCRCRWSSSRSAWACCGCRCAPSAAGRSSRATSSPTSRTS